MMNVYVKRHFSRESPGFTRKITDPETQSRATMGRYTDDYVCRVHPCGTKTGNTMIMSSLDHQHTQPIFLFQFFTSCLCYPQTMQQNRSSLSPKLPPRFRKSSTKLSISRFIRIISGFPRHIKTKIRVATGRLAKVRRI